MDQTKIRRINLPFLITVSILVCVAAIIVNISFLWVNYHYPSGRLSTFVYYAFNSIVSLFFCSWSWFVIPEYFRERKKSLFLLVWLLACMIPLLGVTFVTVGAILLHWYKESDPEELVGGVHVMRFIQEKSYSETFFSEGGAWMRLQNELMSTEDRVKSLSAVNITKGKFTNYVNRLMVQDQNDELRLYAFSLLDKQENEINNWITYFIKMSKHPKDSSMHRNSVRQLAGLYWEMYYLNLSQDNIRQFMLDKSKKFALEGVELDPKDGSLRILLAKIAIEMNDGELARSELQRALAIGVPIRQVSPYIAEIEFRAKNYDAVRSNLVMDRSLKYMLTLAPVVGFWERP